MYTILYSQALCSLPQALSKAFHQGNNSTCTYTTNSPPAPVPVLLAPSQHPWPPSSTQPNPTLAARLVTTISSPPISSPAALSRVHWSLYLPNSSRLEAGDGIAKSGRSLS